MEKIGSANQEHLMGDWLLEKARANEPIHTLLSRLVANIANCETVIENGLLHYEYLETQAQRQAEACRSTGRPEDARLAAYYWRLQAFYRYMANHYLEYASKAFGREDGANLNGESLETFHVLIDEARLRSPDSPGGEEPAEFAFGREEIANSMFEEAQRRKFITKHRRYNLAISRLLGPEELAGRKIPLYYLEPLCQLAETCHMIASEAGLAQFIILPEAGWSDCDRLAI
ncbi:hypothetical protein F4X86_00060 [Candidatus Saccharibacteria bacterium]|nr:hypothetical protein [Candidatus Saccharibacteria bacterium]